jgi:hypothetical protein
MKTKTPNYINSVEEAKDFLRDLFNNGEAYNPEDDAIDVIKVDSGDRVFTDDEAEEMNVLMSQVLWQASSSNGLFDAFDFLNDLGANQRSEEVHEEDGQMIDAFVQYINELREGEPITRKMKDDLIIEYHNCN